MANLEKMFYSLDSHFSNSITVFSILFAKFAQIKKVSKYSSIVFESFGYNFGSKLSLKIVDTRLSSRSLFAFLGPFFSSPSKFHLDLLLYGPYWTQIVTLFDWPSDNEFLSQ